MLYLKLPGVGAKVGAGVGSKTGAGVGSGVEVMGSGLYFDTATCWKFETTLGRVTRTVHIRSTLIIGFHKAYEKWS